MHRSAVFRQMSRAAASPVRSSPSSSPSSAATSLLHRLPSSSARIARRTQMPAWSSSTRMQTRAYADSAPEAEGAKKDGEGDGAADGELGKVKAELEAKNKEVVELKDKYLRSVADFRNLQERSKREQTQARDFAITRFAKDLVESVDNFDRAMSVVPEEKLTEAAGEANSDLKNLYDGLRMTERILMNTLAKHGLERFDPAVEAEKFDPNKHEAAFMTKMEGKEDGTVFSTMQKGFMLNGRIIRAAKVGVVKNS